MAKLEAMSNAMRSHLILLTCPPYATSPWASGSPLSHGRVRIISTAGLHRRRDRPFEDMAGDYRIIAKECHAKDLVMTHISPILIGTACSSAGMWCFLWRASRKLPPITL